jgi:hypothetical protein
MTAVDKLIAALEARGCEPRQISPGVWLAACPACRAEGRFGLLEINVTDGTKIRCAAEATR